jgi:L-threonylcarbamoyladenylate synthase
VLLEKHFIGEIMEIIKEKEFLSGKFDDKVKNFLESNGIIIFPSESSYGFAGNALNEKVCEKIHSVKKEEKTKPIGVITNTYEKTTDFLEINEKGKKLLEKRFSSPITILFQIKKKTPCTSNEFAGIRIPLNNTALKLCSLVDFPLTAPSANIHNCPAIYDSKEIQKTFGKEKFILINAGVLEVRAPSTYYDFENKKILRAGDISLKEIEKVLK